MNNKILITLLSLSSVVFVNTGTQAQQLERLPYNNPGLLVDLGVGLWAWLFPWILTETG